MLLHLTYRTDLGKKENLLTLLFRTRNPACRQGIMVQAAWSELQHRQEEPSAFKETRECLNPCRTPAADTHSHPRALPSPTTPPRPWPGGCPWSRQKPRGCKSLLMEPPWKAPAWRGRAGRGLSGLTKIITVIISSFQRITIISVINSLNNSKAITAITAIPILAAITHCTNHTTSRKIPTRAWEPDRRLWAPQSARSALFISIMTN